VGESTQKRKIIGEFYSVAYSSTVARVKGASIT
jgi:hypothetical protein